jgi:hypothetical protein
MCSWLKGLAGGKEKSQCFDHWLPTSHDAMKKRANKKQTNKQTQQHRKRYSKPFTRFFFPTTIYTGHIDFQSICHHRMQWIKNRKSNQK